MLHLSDSSNNFRKTCSYRKNIYIFILISRLISDSTSNIYADFLLYIFYVSTIGQASRDDNYYVPQKIYTYFYFYQPTRLSKHFSKTWSLGHALYIYKYIVLIQQLCESCGIQQVNIRTLGTRESFASAYSKRVPLVALDKCKS